MKKILTLAITACLCASAMAQNEFRDRHMAYKGFADIGLGSTFTNGESATTFTLTTSHGVQLTPKAFIGAGIGVNLATTSITDGSTVFCPIFAQARCNLLETHISPYLDFKGGGSVGDFKGGYLEPSFGVSMPVANRFAIDFSFAYTLYTHREKYEDWGFSSSERESMHNIGFKFGFEF